MFYFLLLCTVGIGVLGLLVRAILISVLEKFRVTHGLKKKKKNIFKRVFGYIGLLICLMLPVVQIAMIIMMLLVIVAYSQTRDEQLIEKLKKDWEK
jgi:urea transporter